MNELTYQDLELPGFVYSTKIGRIGYVELDVSDALKAVVLGGLSGIIVGHSEKGKSYFGKLASNFYFNGFASRDNPEGNALLVQGASIEENTDLITQLLKRINKEEAKTVVKEELLKKPYWLIEELGAIPRPLQSAFYSVGDGILPHEGTEYPLGIEVGNHRYFSMLATTNTLSNGDGDYGNFGVTRATASRFHVCLDLRYYTRSDEDIMRIALDKNFTGSRHTNKGHTNLTNKILEAYKTIMDSAANPSLEELTAWNLISIGSSNCINGKPHTKDEETWHTACMDCSHEKDCHSKFLNCRELMRVGNTIRTYSNALAYIAKLKNPDAEIDVADAVFIAAKFALAGKYGVVNQNIKNTMHNGSEGALLNDAVEKLRNDFLGYEPYIQASIEALNHGIGLTQFIEERKNGKISELGDYSKLSKKAKKEIAPIEPYHDNGLNSIGLGWMKTFIKMINEANKKQGAIK